MKTITLNSVKYQCPDNWNDIKVEDQIRVSKVSKQYSGMSEQLILISAYCNIPMQVIKETHISKLPTLVKHLEFLNKDIDDSNINEFEHKGEKYYIMPSLIKGQLQDWISLESVFESNKDEPYEGLPMMIAILAKRDGETIDDYDIMERSKEFLDLPLPIANRISSFFLNLNKMRSFLPTPTSSEGEIVMLATDQLRKEFELLESTISKLDTGKHSLSKYQKTLLINFSKRIKQSWEKSLTSTQ